MLVRCDYCNGEGKVDKNGNPPSSGAVSSELFPCPQCEGQGKKRPAKDDLLTAAQAVLDTLGARQEYERQSDRWDDEDHAAMDALRAAVEKKGA